jgi:hypothetical protein
MTTPDDRLDATLHGLGQSPRSDEALASLADAARRELAARPKVRRWWVDGLALFALSLSMAVGASAAMSWSTRQHASSLAGTLIAGGWLTVMAVGSLLWLKPGRSGPRWLVGGLFAVASALAVFGASGADPGRPFFTGMSCAFVECGVALAPLAAVLALSSRFASTPGHVFLGGLTASASGALALHLHCPNGTLEHLLTFHLAPALLLGLAAMGVHRVMRRRSFVP